MKEKRHHNRMQADYEVYLTCQGHSLVGLSRDISPSGIGILMNEGLAPGTPVELRIVMPKATLNMELTGSVCYCIENPDQSRPTYSYLAGIQYRRGQGEAFSLIGPQGQAHRYSASATVSISASAQECYQAIGDFEHYPEWADVVTKAQLLERYPDGRGRRVDYENKFFFIQIHYLLDYSFDDQNLCMSWKGGGKDLGSIEGHYIFRPLGESLTAASCEVSVILNFPISERIAQYISRIALRKSMRDFKNYLEKKVNSSRP